jgi:hypothetical protein
MDQEIAPVPIRGTYMNKPTLSLPREANDRFPFTFGVAKAILILENIDAIRAFVKDHQPKETK